MRNQLFAIASLLILGLAGCAGGPAPPTENEDGGPIIENEAGTGGIRGVVVDQNIQPVPGATVVVIGTEETTTTDEEGLFVFSDLEPNTYFVEASKQLYDPMQTQADVIADDPSPKMISIQINKLLEGTPFYETFPFEGFYECAFAAHGLVFWITDSCDMAVRTAHDAGATVLPRQIQNNYNTAYFAWQSDIVSVVQEAFWDDAATPEMWVSVDSTPIDNECDCSDYTYVEASGPPPTYGRTDISEEVTSPETWPTAGEDVAIRGFIPPPSSGGEPRYAIDLQFDIYTTFFHNYIPQDGWNLEDADEYPVPA